MSRRGGLRDNMPMESFFRGFKTEWIPETGYKDFTEAERSIVNYLIDYYSSIKLHQHNNSNSQNKVEKNLLEEILTCGQI